MSLRIGVISDTHISGARPQVPPAALAALAGASCILHAGDILVQSVLDQLSTIAPVHAVFGNCDPPELSWRLPDRVVLEIGGARLGLTHGHLGHGRSTPECALAYFSDTPDLHVVVFGHSHQPYNQQHGGILLFNPGSATQRRSEPYPSCGLIEITGDGCRGTIIHLR